MPQESVITALISAESTLAILSWSKLQFTCEKKSISGTLVFRSGWGSAFTIAVTLKAKVWVNSMYLLSAPCGMDFILLTISLSLYGSPNSTFRELSSNTVKMVKLLSSKFTKKWESLGMPYYGSLSICLSVTAALSSLSLKDIMAFNCSLNYMECHKYCCSWLLLFSQTSDHLAMTPQIKRLL